MSLRSLPVASAAVVGTRTNDNAAPGNIGEFVTSSVPSGSAVQLTSTTPTNVTSISLTAGDWDLEGVVDYALASSTSITTLIAGVSLTSATLAPQTGGGGLGTDPTASYMTAAQVPGNGNMSLETSTVRLSIAATTTVFLVASATFTVLTCFAFGTIRARRVR